MIARSRTFLARSLAVCALWALAVDGLSAAPDARDTRYFRLDKAGKLLGPASHVPPVLALTLASVTPDQPQFWPEETLRVRVLMPGRGGQALSVRWNKRDAAARDLTGAALDADGVAVIELANGREKRHELGEYRVEIKTLDGKAQGSTTFAVVEGTLGAVSLAYAFDRVTSAADLDARKAGWYLGNGGGAGSRWGNGLSFKNELRVDNVPYDGEVELIPRCMLSGCNGVVAGPHQHLRVDKGQLAATLNVGGHSGPFQVEIVTPQGSLRHQFDGSGHVEREMIPISRGVRFAHRVGLAPYTHTTQVPGRAFFVDRLPQPADGDAFEVDSPIATGGKVLFRARQDLKNLVALVYAPRGDGTFAPNPAAVPAAVRAGDIVAIAIHGPLALVALGGQVRSAGKDEFREGHVLAFVPGGLDVALDAPKVAAPNGQARVAIELRDGQGNPVQGSLLVEAYDIRVAARDPLAQLHSAVGDTARRAGRHLDSWVDPIELERQRLEQERQRKQEEREEREQERRRQREERQMRHTARREAAKADGVGYGHVRVYGVGAAGSAASVGYGSGAAAGSKLMVRTGHVHAPVSQHPQDDGDEGEVVREGEVKIAFVGAVRTGADGKAQIDVPLPPQTGRLAWRATAIAGLDWASAERQTDLVRQASVEIKAPRALVAGGTLDLQLVTQSKATQTLHLQVSGAGFARAVSLPVPSGKHTHLLAWPAQAGEIVAALVDEEGKVHDKRKVAIADVAKQKVTWSRLATGGGKVVTAKAGERVTAYATPGALLHGTVGQMVTTMESWFPHAEALSAQVAVRATLLAAIERRLLADDGHFGPLRGGFEQAVLQLHRALYDAQTRMIRPYPGVAPSPLWSAWVASNLHIARRAFAQVPQARNRVGSAAAAALDQLAKDLGDGMVARGEKTEPFGFSAARDGAETVEIAVQGGGRFEVVTDDAVQQFVVDQLLPALDDCGDACGDSKALGKALDHFRLVRAFSRVGRLQWLVAQAKAALAAGPKGQAAFDKLFDITAQGFVLSQEPGMLQGPALLGGVYSQPMALPRFVELLLQMGLRGGESGAIAATVDDTTRKVRWGEGVDVKQFAELRLPRGAIARIDRPGVVDLRASADKPFARVSLAKTELGVGEASELLVELDATVDPLEFYALVAVPATVAIRQTQDALSDYKGQLAYGQQAMGAAKMQIIAVPFRGSRSMRIWIEGLLPGHAPGLVAVRHVHDSDRGCAVAIAPIRVRAEKAVAAGQVARPGN
ncbi:MAG: hypothetical protein FJ100_19050 [Deltaproteobacteria bacterium]|nr:hypothetical protein [Deltaproteobacteria bacterium]